MRIKPLEHNFNPPFGVEYSIHIGEVLALKLLGKPLKVGYCADYCTVQDTQYSDFKHRLTVSNYGGSYMLESSTAKIEKWHDVFGVKVIG